LKGRLPQRLIRDLAARTLFAASVAVAGTARAACAPIAHSQLLEPYVAGAVEPLTYELSDHLRLGAMRVEAPHEGVVYLAVSLTLVAAGVAAAFIPARRAARVDPLIALRAE